MSKRLCSDCRGNGTKYSPGYMTPPRGSLMRAGIYPIWIPPSTSACSTCSGTGWEDIPTLLDKVARVAEGAFVLGIWFVLIYGVHWLMGG